MALNFKWVLRVIYGYTSVMLGIKSWGILRSVCLPKITYCFMRSDHRCWIRMRRNVKGCDQKSNSPVLDDTWRNGAYWWRSGKVNIALFQGISRGVDVSQYQPTLEPEEVMKHSASQSLRTCMFQVTFTGRYKAVNVCVSSLPCHWGPLTLSWNRKDLENWCDPVRSLESAILASPNSSVIQKLTAICPQHGYTRTLPCCWPLSVGDTEFLSPPSKPPLGQTSSISFNDLINFQGIELRSLEIFPLIPDTWTRAFVFVFFYPIFQPSFH